MLQVVLAQLRLNARRFISVSVAVLIAVGFLTATLIINSSSKASLVQSVGSSYRNADLIVTPSTTYTSAYTSADTGVLDDTDVEVINGIPGVDAVYPVRGAYVKMASGRDRTNAQLQNVPESAGLMPDDVLEGRLPDSEGEVAVDSKTAIRLGITLGSVLTLAADDSKTEGAPVELAVSALVSSSHDPQRMGTPQLYSVDTTVEQLAYAGEEYAFSFDNIQLALADGADVEEVRAAVLQQLGQDSSSTVRTAEEQTVETVAGMSGDTDVLTAVLLAFAAVALLVCGLVVSNTFSVLVAQRTRELALLRCIGAGRGQIRRSVVAEALTVGVVSSLAGAAASVALVAGIVSYLKTNQDTSYATLAVAPLDIVAGLVVGVLLTVLAALVPARAATAVAPLAALRPAEDIGIRTNRGQVRLTLGLLLLAGGGLLLGLGAAASDLLVAVPGGMLTFVGLLMCATLFIPSLIRSVGALATPLGVPGKLAAVNAVRNPQRTSATASALLIGVTLVAMIMSGVATARHSLDEVLAHEYPVDVAIIAGPVGDRLTAADAQTAAGVPGVTTALLVPPAGTVEVNGHQLMGVYALEPAEAAGVLRAEDLVPDNGTILMPGWVQDKTVTVHGATSDIELKVVPSESSQLRPLITAETARSIGGVPAGESTPEVFIPSPQLWLALDDELDTGAVMGLRGELAEALGVEDWVITGSAMERASFEQGLDVLLLVVTGLLAVAVVIALVGVANTLSLSVLERTRESSLLRALGLTRGQLRGMLALEAVLISGVAAVMGSLLGVLYGWLGAQAALGSFATVGLSLPWLQLLGVLAVALLAGLAASVLPARRAARLSPMAGLSG